MSKANQKFVQADEAVSPVIGVILMVAITVVLAAVVFVLVSNLSKTSTKAPDVSFSTDENTDRISLVKGASGLDWDDFQIKGQVPSGSTVNYIVNANAAAGSTDLSAAYATIDPTSMMADPFNAGDFIDFCGTAAVAGTTNVQILHVESNTVVLETAFVGIAAC